jgi:uncharacterized membrane protein YhhN
MNKSAISRNSALIYAYLLLSVLHLYATGTENTILIYITKPLLLTLLSVWFWLSTRKSASAFSWFILFGLIFSIGGDSFLMFVEKGQQYFIFGLVCFLLAHIGYLTGFIKYKSGEKGILQKKPWLIIFFLAFLVLNTGFLWPSIPDDLKIPVTVYSLAIVSMAAFAMNLYGKIPVKQFTWLFIGVLLFIFSDSMIAINKFHPRGIIIPNGRILIMITYLLSQYLIAIKSTIINGLQR